MAVLKIRRRRLPDRVLRNGAPFWTPSRRPAKIARHAARDRLESIFMTDTEKFRLRHFVEKLVQQGECVVHDDPIDLIDVAAVLDCNPHAVWFRAVGPEKTELVGNVMGTRRRLAVALDTDEPGFPAALRQRLRHPVAPIEVPSAQAPVHEVVLTGDDADLTTLPVHLQHGGPPAGGCHRATRARGNRPKTPVYPRPKLRL